MGTRLVVLVCSLTLGAVVAGCGDNRPYEPDALPCEPVDDGNDCTTDVCDENGQPSTVDRGAGETCSIGVCDGDGVCVECLEDDDCGDGESCTESANTCNPITCTDGKLNGDETDVDCGGSCAPTRRCGDGLGCGAPGDCQSGVCTDDVCTAARCGDGVTQAGEACDDGNDTNGDGCDDGTGDSCRPTGCGNGVVTAPEVCDDNNNMNGDGCDNNCTVTACGNGIRAGAEACDDADAMSGDGCSATCTIEAGYTCNMMNPSVCVGTCGDGVVVAGEACDDAPPAENGDGCSMMCTLEPGFNCTGSPSICTAVCGDGVRAGNEGCDDGDTMAGDGCNATCFVEAGWICTGTPSTCFPICGDGIVRPGELCDDGDLMPGDGCRANCTVETGFTCTGSPSLCTANCGDGMRLGAEVCDDGDLMAGDGCSPTCTRENGWTCDMASPTVCTSSCGDGVPVGTEACDDGDLMNGDGCSMGCTVETGFTCAGTPSTCTGICGDNMVVFGEPCDDPAPVEDGDGCSATCTVELGYNCQGSPSTCLLTCGNGVLDTGEACDDGDNESLDGCSASCGAEVGWTCTGAPSICAPTCGDNLIAIGAEECDDGDAMSDDGCSSTCEIEFGYTCTGVPSVCNTTCGDGLVGGAETCDDSCGPDTPGVCDVMDNGDGCSSTCVNECGNGTLNPALEQCDDNNRIAGDGCSATCTFEVTCGVGETLVQINSTDVPKAIPDANTTALTIGTIGSNAVVPASQVGAITSVTLGIGRITHTWISDVQLTLTSPGGRRRQAVMQRGGSADNLITTRLFDAAPAHIGDGVAPFSGPFRPEESFSTFNGFRGQNPAGTWVLTASDFGGGDTGTIVGWTLSICYAPTGPRCGDGATDPGEECDDGNAVDTDACNNACGVTDGCGDGNLDAGEACDDDNLTSGDGCSSTCTVDIGCEAGETAVVVSNLTSLPIPDSLSAGVLSPVDVAAVGAITKLVPHIAGITHPVTNQLDILLIGPNNVQRTLSSDNGGTLGNLADYRQTYLDDATPLLVSTATAPFYGTFRPEQSLATTAGTDFANLNSLGTWTLKVADDSSSPASAIGTLDGWTLTMCVNPSVPFCGNGAVDGTEECDDGNQDDTDLCTRTCQLTDGCGDGNIDGAEECDDNNIVSGDGCSSACIVDITCAAGETPVIVTNGTAFPVPDNLSTGVLSPVTVATVGAVTKVVPHIANITHPAAGELDLVLIGPNTLIRNLTDDNGGANPNYRQTFLDDTATSAVTSGAAPFTGRFRPEQSLSTTVNIDFRNSRAAGEWNLRVVDDTANNLGTLERWTLTLCVNPGPFCGDSVTNGLDECDDGNLVDNDTCSNTCQVADGCGDGNLDAGEECDDNNVASGDGCSSTCAFDISCAAGETPVIVRSAGAVVIPDAVSNVDSNTVSTLAVPTVGQVRKVQAMLNITHTNLGNLDIYLSSPYGTHRTVIEDRTGTNMFGTIFADAAAGTVTGSSPYTGTFRSSQSFSNAAGFGDQQAQGPWALRVSDDTATNTGTLDSWALGLCVATAPTVCGNGFVEPGETCDDGNAAAGDGCAGCQIELGCAVGETPVLLASLAQHVPLADGQAAVFATNEITVPNTGVVRRAVLVIGALSHKFAGEVDMFLRTPAGTDLDLNTDNLSGVHFASTMFDDRAPTAINVSPFPSAPFRGRWRPETALSSIDGQPAMGTWQIRLAEDGTAGDTGVLGGWTLGLCVE